MDAAQEQERIIQPGRDSAEFDLPNQEELARALEMKTEEVVPIMAQHPIDGIRQGETEDKEAGVVESKTFLAMLKSKLFFMSKT